jgi:hypothetical protein
MTIVRHAIAPVRDDHPRHILQAFQQTLEEPLGCTSITLLLNQNIKDDTILIYGAPQMMLNALDPNEHLIEVPLVARPGTTAVQSASKALAEFLTPALHCLAGDHDAARGQKQLKIPQDEAEHMIEPNPWLMISAGNR